MKTEVKAEKKGSVNGASLSHRLIPIEKRVLSVDVEVAETIAELEAAESLSFEEYVEYQEQLNALFGQVGASTNQLQAVTKKFGENSLQVAEAKAEINLAFSTIVEAQYLLESIDVIEEAPEQPEASEAPEEPEEPAEPEGETPDEPVTEAPSEETAPLS